MNQQKAGFKNIISEYNKQVAQLFRTVQSALKK